MKNTNTSYPLVSILIPTLNAQRVLDECLASISTQNYPSDRVEVIVADGGSHDATIEIAHKYGAKVVSNPLRTGEAGKMTALRASAGEFAAFIDSDNVLPYGNWLIDMITPLLDRPEAVGSEPWEYTWRKEDGFITRYCALIGMNDPLVHFLGNYDRTNLLTGKWTEVPHDEQDFGDYLLAKFDPRGLPTIGANGTVFRSDYLRQAAAGDYLFDIDIIAKTVIAEGSVKFIKVKNGIVHSYCERSVKKFALKQRRRVKDFLFHKWQKKDRYFGWYDKDLFSSNPWGLVKFILYCVTIMPLLAQAVKGWSKKHDIAWFFHPLACEITLWEYGWGRVFGVFSKAEQDRRNYSQ